MRGLFVLGVAVALSGGAHAQVREHGAQVRDPLIIQAEPLAQVILPTPATRPQVRVQVREQVIAPADTVSPEARR